MRYLIPVISLLALFCVDNVDAQGRKMSPIINKSSVSITAPSISGDGKKMVYLSDYTMSEDYTMMFAENNGGWQTPVELPTTFNNSKVNYVFGHSLSFDGTTLYYSTRRGASKGYDIWFVTWEGDRWSNPKRMPDIINTDLHEASASFTPDGTELYFTRCTAMLTYNASGCDIFYTRMENGNWTTPEKLPEKINAANDQAPKILADSKTLIYASNKPGGKGKFDLYQARKTEDGWSDPVAIDMVNTPEDEIVSTMRMYGNILLVGQTEGKTDQIMEFFIPQELKPEKFMFLDFQLNRDFFAKEATLIIENLKSGDIVRRSRIDSGRHSIVLNEGSTYHVMIQPTHLKRSVVSKVYDLNELVRPQFKKDEFDLTMLSPGREMLIEGVTFDSSTPLISDKSNTVLEHVNKMVKLNSDLNFEMQLVMTNYMEDTLFVHEDMTEVRYDTTYTTRIDTVFIEPKLDSLLDAGGDSVDIVITIDTTGEMTGEVVDTTQVYTVVDSVTVVEDLRVEPQFELVEVEEMHVTKIYHNDRSVKEEAELRSRMQAAGVPDNRINITRLREEQNEALPNRFLRVIVK